MKYYLAHCLADNECCINASSLWRPGRLRLPFHSVELLLEHGCSLDLDFAAPLVSREGHVTK